jgi:hypothetical protein
LICPGGADHVFAKESTLETSPQEAAKFLHELKALIVNGSGLHLIFRPEHHDDIVELGLNKAAIDSIVVGLSVADYCSGPNPDRDKPGYVWEFARNINSHDVYIKLKIADGASSRMAICISFHKAKYPLRFPLRS